MGFATVFSRFLSCYAHGANQLIRDNGPMMGRFWANVGEVEPQLVQMLALAAKPDWVSGGFVFDTWSASTSHWTNVGLMMGELAHHKTKIGSKELIIPTVKTSCDILSNFTVKYWQTWLLWRLSSVERGSISTKPSLSNRILRNSMSWLRKFIQCFLHKIYNETTIMYKY